jgi:uncharacterized protein (TIGR02996 family)
MPPGHEPFLRAICDNPADDTVRLAFADWLDENGDPRRAEFIRCQVEAARTGGGKGDAHRRAQKLKHSHKKKWLRELPALPGVAWGEFRRGFVAAATLPAEGVAELLPAVCAAVPVEDLQLRDCTPEALLRAVGSPLLKNFRRLLAPTGAVGEDGVCALANRPEASTLEMLALPGGWPRVTDRGILALCRSPHLARLRLVMIGAAHCSEATLREAHARFTFVCLNWQATA